MTTIIRVKRHRGIDPVDALILSCKRKKTDEAGDSGDSNADSFEKILNFSGTVEEKDDKIATNTVKSFTKDSKHAKINKTHIPEIKAKQRKEWKEKSDDNRFTLLSCLRSNNLTEGTEEGSEEDGSNCVTIFDVSKENEDQSSQKNGSDYVYDLYSTNFEGDSDFNDLYMENLLSVQPLEYELVYRNGEDCFEEIDPDEDDSNDENNWRNDYPDTDSEMDEDDDGDVLAKQLKGFHLDNESYELSGDSGEEEYPNYKDDEDYYFYEAKDWVGRKYAKYKANAMKHLMDDDKNESEDDDSDEEEFRDCEVLSYHENSD